MDHAQFWDRVADKYARDKIADPEAYEYTLGRTASYLRPGDHVIEFGAGTASTALRLALGVERYTATDISAEMVRIGREKLAQDPVPGLDIEVGSFATMRGGSYDAVLAFNLFHLSPDIPGALADARAMLRPGGHFISKTPCLGDHPGWLKRNGIRAAIPVMQMFGKAPRPVTLLTIADLERMVIRAGFEIVETGNYPASAPSRYIVAR
ncbi:MAG: class I SAM-dependent methyltransferase [Pseudomonadota bacterium]